MKNIMIFVTKILISAFLMGYIFSKIDLVLVKTYFYDFPYFLFLIAGLSISLSLLMGARRWQLILNAQDVSPSFHDVQKVNFIGWMFNQGLPSSIGGDVYRAYWVKSHFDGYGGAITSVFLDRLYGMVGLLLIAMVALALQSAHLHSVFWVFLGPCALVLGASVFGVWLIRHKGHHIPLPFLQGIVTTIQSFKASFSCHVQILFWTLISHLSGFFAFQVIGWGVGVSLSWLQLCLVIPLVFMMGAIPISLAGWGLREGIMIFALAHYGVSSEKAMALSLIYGLSQFLPAIWGGIVWTLNREKHG